LSLAIFSDNSVSGTVSWSNPGNAVLSDDNLTQASVVLSLLASANTHYLVAESPGFTIPAGASICGIAVTVERSAGGISLGGSVKDASIKLVKNGVISGTDHASATAWPGSDANASYGSNSDLWGLSWLPADINAANFGVAIKTTLTAGIASVGLSASIDQVIITVYYQNAIVMPVRIEQFTVSTKTGVPNITWTVPPYEGVTKFLVERSTDARNWETIKVLPNILYIREYSFVDPNPMFIDSYYRVGVENEGGNLVYSAIRKVSPQGVVINVYPNPATGVIYIRGRRHSAGIVIKDLTGRVMKSLTIDPRLLLAQVPIAGLHPGIYLLEVDGTTFRITKE
jgi:hypothetical protein